MDKHEPATEPVPISTEEELENARKLDLRYDSPVSALWWSPENGLLVGAPGALTLVAGPSGDPTTRPRRVFNLPEDAVRFDLTGLRWTRVRTEDHALLSDALGIKPDQHRWVDMIGGVRALRVAAHAVIAVLEPVRAKLNPAERQAIRQLAAALDAIDGNEE